MHGDLESEVLIEHYISSDCVAMLEVGIKSASAKGKNDSS